MGPYPRGTGPKTPKAVEAARQAESRLLKGAAVESAIGAGLRSGVVVRNIAIRESPSHLSCHRGEGVRGQEDADRAKAFKDMCDATLARKADHRTPWRSVVAGTDTSDDFRRSGLSR